MFNALPHSPSHPLPSIFTQAMRRDDYVCCCCCCFRHCRRRAHDSGSLSFNWHGWWRLLTPSVDDRARSPRPPPSTWRPSPATPPPARSTPLTRSVMPQCLSLPGANRLHHRLLLWQFRHFSALRLIAWHIEIMGGLYRPAHSRVLDNTGSGPAHAHSVIRRATACQGYRGWPGR